MSTTEASPGLALEKYLHNLRIFLAVADAKSIAGGSAQLFKASSAVARSITELERFLAAPLFERKPRGMLINAFGEAVLARSRRIDAEIQQAADEFLKLTPKSSRPSRNAIVNLLFSGRKLEVVVRLAERRSISAVASEMGLTQAGASMALSRIEAVFGQPLFHRRMEGMAPTEAAERLVQHARLVLTELRHMRSDLLTLAGEPSGSVVVGATHLGRTNFYPTAITRAIARYPGIQVTSVESPYEQLIQGLRSGEIDIVFGVLRPAHLSAGLRAEPLFEDRMCVLARAGHTLARRDRLDMAELLNEKWVLPRPNAVGKAQVDDCFLQLGLAPPTPSVETGDLAMLRQLLTTSDMLAITSPLQFMFEIQSGLLTELPVTLAGTTLEIGMIVRENAMLSPAALALIDAVRAQVRERAHH